MAPGDYKKLLRYNKNRVFAFVVALNAVDEEKYATAAGAISYGFPTIAETPIPEILPRGVTTYEHVVSMPFNEIDGKDDLERAERGEIQFRIAPLQRLHAVEGMVLQRVDQFRLERRAAPCGAERAVNKRRRRVSGYRHACAGGRPVLPARAIGKPARASRKKRVLRGR